MIYLSNICYLFCLYFKYLYFLFNLNNYCDENYMIILIKFPAEFL